MNNCTEFPIDVLAMGFALGYLAALLGMVLLAVMYGERKP
jgi:hypothetical protein